jgi:predicted transglutaminase-like cysteine proteinase
MTFGWAKTISIAAGILIAGSISTLAGAQNNDQPFMTVTGKTSQPIGHYDFCQRYRAECEIKSTAERRMRLTPKAWNELAAVNNDVNTRIAPATDMEIYGKTEWWEYPQSRGDCEDLVLLKRRELAKMGWPIGDLLITVVKQKNGDGHAVLTVLTDKGDLVLDNLDPHIKLWSETPYTYIKRQSGFDTGKWVSIEDGRGSVEVGSLGN